MWQSESATHAIIASCWLLSRGRHVTCDRQRLYVPDRTNMRQGMCPCGFQVSEQSHARRSAGRPPRRTVRRGRVEAGSYAVGTIDFNQKSGRLFETLIIQASMPSRETEGMIDRGVENEHEARGPDASTCRGARKPHPNGASSCSPLVRLRGLLSSFKRLLGAVTGADVQLNVCELPLRVDDDVAVMRRGEGGEAGVQSVRGCFAGPRSEDSAVWERTFESSCRNCRSADQ